MSELPISEIVVAGRCRQDMGDIATLADSIRELGLLHPVVITDTGQLIAGERRLRACRSLGWTDVPVTMVSTLTTAVQLICAERDENTCRKELLPTEMVSLGEKLEEIERPKATQRRIEGNRRGGIGEVADPGTRDLAPTPTAEVTREIVGGALGISGATYQRAKSVVQAIDDPDPEVSAVAREAAATMDLTGAVKPAAAKVAQTRRARLSLVSDEATEKSRVTTPAEVDQIREMATAGSSSHQIAARLGRTVETIRGQAKQNEIEIPADAVIGRRQKVDQTKVFDDLVLETSTIAFGVGLVDFDDLDPERIAGWVDSLSPSIRSLNQMLKRLKELAQ